MEREDPKTEPKTSFLGFGGDATRISSRGASRLLGVPFGVRMVPCAELGCGTLGELGPLSIKMGDE